MAYVCTEQIMIFTLQSDLTGVTAGNGQLALTLDVFKLFTYSTSSSSWIPSSSVSVKKSIATVTGTSTGATTIYTLEASTLNFYPIMVIFRAVSISGVVIIPTVSVGTNSTSYNNIATGSLLSSVLSTIGANGGAPQAASTSIPLAGGSVIKANVTIGATATSYTFNVEVIGFYDI